MDCTDFKVEGARDVLYGEPLSVTCNECENWTHKFEGEEASLAEINDVTQEHARDYHG